MADPKPDTTETAKPPVKTETAVAQAEAAKAEATAEPNTAAEAPEPAKAEPAKPQPPEAAPKAKEPKRTVKAAKPAAAPRKKKAPKRAARKNNVKKAAPARAGAKNGKGAIKMNKQTKTAAENSAFAADQFKAVFGDVNERAKSAMEKNARVAEELADLTRGNVEAFVASSKAAAKGVETLSQEAADYGRRSFEEASAALKGFAEVKSATDFFKLQSDYARSAFDAIIAENAKLSETMIKVAGDVAEPITSRYSVAAERVKNIAA